MILYQHKQTVELVNFHVTALRVEGVDNEIPPRHDLVAAREPPRHHLVAAGEPPRHPPRFPFVTF